MNIAIVLLVLFIRIDISYSQCKNDKHFKNYYDLILAEKDTINKLFDEILDKYGDIYRILKELLNELSGKVKHATSNLDKLGNINKNITNTNNDSSKKLKNLLEKINSIENELKLINSSRNLLEELNRAEESSKKIVPVPEDSNIAEHQAELIKWRNFLNGLKGNYAENLMNLPHAVSEELNILEKLIGNQHNSQCLAQFHDKLKALFVELANLLYLDIYKDEIDDINQKASKNKNDAENVLDETNKFLEQEKQFKDIHRLTNNTLTQAKEIEKLKNEIVNLSENNEKASNERLKKLQEQHEIEVEKLEKKYNVKKGQILLKQLEDIKEKTKGIDLKKLESEVDNYILDINYFTCIFRTCGLTVVSSSSCERGK